MDLFASIVARPFFRPGIFLVCLAGFAVRPEAQAVEAARRGGQVPGGQATAQTQQVKRYLLEGVGKMTKAAASLDADAKRYSELIAASKGDYARAAKEHRKEVAALVQSLRDDYNAADSFGYETIEGIVGGVSSLVDFDVYLDSGVPKEQASTDSPAAPVSLALSNGKVLEGPGSLFTYVIAPMLWGRKAEYVVAVDVDGDGTIAPHESLPKVEILEASAAAVQAKVGELARASEAWEPTVRDCFSAVLNMTPTLSGYFDDWRESRYAGREGSGLFAAVSRVSDMKGIMRSVSFTYDAVDPAVKAKDPALAASIERGFSDILGFLDRIEAREKKGAIQAAQVEELGAQAKEKAGKLVPQLAQAAALLDLGISN